MRRLRDVFYINGDPEENKFEYYGMELREFLSCAPFEINQMLLLQAEYYGRGFSSRSKFEVVDKSEMDDFLKEEIYSYGDFSWVDFTERDGVERLEPIEIAELLYLGHMFEPINSPFFGKLNNRFSYLAHDDGWYCKLYCRDNQDFKEILANKLIKMISTSKRRKIVPLSESLKDDLLNLTKDGLVIDFSNVIMGDGVVEVPVHTIGKFSNMDDMYNELRKLISHSSYSAKLVHKNKNWSLLDKR